MDEGPTLNSPSDGFSQNICSGDSWSLPTAQKTFSLREGVSPYSSDGACSAVAERSVSTAQSDCVGPCIPAAELLRISPKQCIPTADKSCGYSRVLTFSQTRSLASTSSGRSSC
jgi:hypothetical protein